LRGPTYSADELEIIEDKWGTVTPNAIALLLGRSLSAIINKKTRMGLGSFLESGEYITVNQLFKAIGRDGGISYTLDKWVKIGFPLKTKKVISTRYRIIHLEDFWKWAEICRMHIDFNKFKENSLGAEPSWVKDQRRADVEFAKYKVTPWTPKEDSLLRSLLKLYKYTYRDLSIQISRTEGAIKRRYNDLKIKDWPIRENPHGIWTDLQVNTVIEMYQKGYRSTVIKEYITKSEQAINGKIERLIRDALLTKWK